VGKNRGARWAVITLLSTPSPEDLVALARLVALGSATLEIEAELERAFARFWVARNDQRIVGFLLAWDVADEVHLLDLVVEPGERRKGVGRSLMHTLLEHSRSRRAATILLEVRKSNEAARRLYEAAGFSASGERAAYYGDGEDAVLMRLDLEAC
jgi:[ribosomal protein S18]-alanine N-acetyltransferase